MGMTPEQGIILQFDAARSLAVNRRKTHHVTEQRPHRIGPQPLLLYPHAEDAIHDDGLLIPNIPLDLQISPVFVLQDLATDGVSTDLQDFRDRGRGRFDIDNGPWFHEDGQDGLLIQNSGDDTVIYKKDAGVVKEVMRLKDSGVVNMKNLPTSSGGLVAGDLWNNSGVVNII